MSIYASGIGYVATAGPRGPLMAGEHDETDVSGCSESPGDYGCLVCPLAACRYDDPGWYSRYRSWRTALEHEAIVSQYPTLMDASRATGIGERSLARSRRRVLAGEPVPS